jgi:hypothetical protein
MIFKPVYDQVQMASAMFPNLRRRDVFSESTVMMGEPRSIHDFPDEIMLKILSYLGPEDLCFIIPEVCERWNALAKDVILWEKMSYSCDRTSDFSRVVQVRCATLLGFRIN